MRRHLLPGSDRPERGDPPRSPSRTRPGPAARPAVKPQVRKPKRVRLDGQVPVLVIAVSLRRPCWCFERHGQDAGWGSPDGGTPPRHGAGTVRPTQVAEARARSMSTPAARQGVGCWTVYAVEVERCAGFCPWGTPPQVHTCVLGRGRGEPRHAGPGSSRARRRGQRGRMPRAGWPAAVGRRGRAVGSGPDVG